MKRILAFWIQKVSVEFHYFLLIIGLLNFRRNRVDSTIISLTSYSKRLNYLDLTLKSLLIQSRFVIPIYVYLCQEDLENMPKKLKRFEKFGVFFKSYKKNLRQYLKIVPASIEFSEKYIITVDDDIVYHRTMVSELLACSGLNQKVVLGHRGRILNYTQDRKSVDYANSKLFNLAGLPTEDLLLTGVGGIMYAPNSLGHLSENQKVFERICPTNDDIWLHYFTRESGYIPMLVPSKRRRPIETSAGKIGGLWKTNNLQNSNQIQFEKAIEYFSKKVKK